MAVAVNKKASVLRKLLFSLLAFAEKFLLSADVVRSGCIYWDDSSLDIGIISLARLKMIFSAFGFARNLFSSARCFIFGAKRYNAIRDVYHLFKGVFVHLCLKIRLNSQFNVCNLLIFYNNGLIGVIVIWIDSTRNYPRATEFPGTDFLAPRCWMNRSTSLNFPSGRLIICLCGIARNLYWVIH